MYTPIRSFTFFILSVSCIPRTSDVRLPFFLTLLDPCILMGENDTTVGALLSVWLLSVLVVGRFCNALWSTIFCAFVLHDCICDMDHDSVINYYIWNMFKTFDTICFAKKKYTGYQGSSMILPNCCWLPMIHWNWSINKHE